MVPTLDYETLNHKFKLNGVAKNGSEVIIWVLPTRK